MDIGTAKPTPEQRARVPHHFIDEREIDDPVSAGSLATEAWQRIESIYAREKGTVATGGSTLYLKALVEGLMDVPPVPPEMRDRLNQRLQAEGAETLYEELRRVDPVSAASMDATKSQRIVRALEVYAATGRPLSAFRENQPAPPFDFRVIVLSRDRAELYERINLRVDLMLETGLVDEVRHLLDSGFDEHLPAMRTIGYQEPLRFLRGELDHTEMVRLLKRNTRRYAKRQLTWFRGNAGYHWIDASESLASITAEVMRLLEADFQTGGRSI